MNVSMQGIKCELTRIKRDMRMRFASSCLRTPVNAKPEQAMAPYYTSVRAEDISATPCMSCVGWSSCCSATYSRWRGSPSEIAYEEGWGLDDCSKGENKNNEINKLGY